MLKLGPLVTQFTGRNYLFGRAKLLPRFRAMIALSFNGKPEATALEKNNVAFGLPLNNLW